MSNNVEAIELASVANGQWDATRFDPAGHDFSLPPVDRGRHAWSFLAVCFIFEAVIWGFPYSFGIFQTYYTTNGSFGASTSGIAAVGTTATGLMYFGSPFVMALMRTYPHLVRKLSAVGLILILTAVVAASFARTVWQVILTEGVLYAIGGSLLYMPAIIYVDEWFVHRKGLAFGIMWGGTGTSGILCPLLLQWLLNDYGFRTALRVWAVVCAVLLTPCLFALKGRLPIPKPGTGQRRRLSFEYCRTSTFWILQGGNTLQGLGSTIPSIYLPSYAQTIGLSKEAASLSLSIVNAALVVGMVGFGAVVDRVQVTTAILISSLGASAACLLVWSLSSSLAPLYIFAILYGVFAGGYTSCWPGIVNKLRERCTDDRQRSGVDTGMVFALLAVGKGLGSVVSGPLSEKLLQADHWRGHGIGAFGNGYGSLVIWSGVTMFLGGISWFMKQLGRL